MRHAAALIALAVACGHPPATRPAGKELPADRPADLAGQWVASDAMDWGYDMRIEPNGVIDVWIDRGKMGRCEQKGRMVSGTASRVFEVTYTHGDCNRNAVGVPIEMTITSYTGEHLTVGVAGQHRTYQRAPESKPQ